MQDKISLNSQLAKFGIGLFETMKIYQGEVVFLEEHLKRLYSSIDKLGVFVQITQKELKEEIINYVKGLDYQALRVTLFNDGYHLSLRDITYKQEDYEIGYSLKLAPVKRGSSFLYQHKTANYFENIYSKRDAIQSGYDEALFVNIEDEILEGSMSNIFFIKGRTVYTPKKELGLLPGIIRSKVINLSQKLGLELEIGEIELKEISNFDFCFITNSLMDLMKVKEIEDIGYQNENEIFDIINKEFKKIYKKKG